jgi:uncharacterized RDD family membrane protein YckC
LADFGKRFLQYLIDSVIVGLLPFILILAKAGGVGILLDIVIAFAYFTFLEGSPAGQTLGMKALGIRVVDAQTGGPIDFGRAALRTLGRYLSSIFYIGYLWVAFDSNNQGWHDKIARTLVINTGPTAPLGSFTTANPASPPPPPAAERPGPLANAAAQAPPPAPEAPPPAPEAPPPAPPRQDAPPANWYPDPQGQARLRYWDGNGWTEHTAQ